MKMTNTLLMAYEWYRNCPKTWKDRALDSIKNTLTGEFTGTVATARGDRFEEFVNNIINKNLKFHKPLRDCNLLRGLRQQVWLDPLTITLDSEMSFTFRGKMDYYGTLLANEHPVLERYAKQKIICDLKTTGTTIKQDKYMDSWQHVIYCLAMKVPHFAYFVFQFPDDHGLEPSDSRIIFLDCEEELDAQRKMLTDRIGDLVKFLKDFNLWNDYFHKFNQGKP